MRQIGMNEPEEGNIHNKRQMLGSITLSGRKYWVVIRTKSGIEGDELFITKVLMNNGTVYIKYYHVLEGNLSNSTASS